MIAGWLMVAFVCVIFIWWPIMGAKPLWVPREVVPSELLGIRASMSSLSRASSYLVSASVC